MPLYLLTPDEFHAWQKPISMNTGLNGQNILNNGNDHKLFIKEIVLQCSIQAKKFSLEVSTINPERR